MKPYLAAAVQMNSLPDLHNILVSLVFPEKVSASQRFNLMAGLTFIPF